MGWLLEIYFFFRDFEKEWGTREARRNNLLGCLAVLAIGAFVGIVVFSVFIVRSSP